MSVTTLTAQELRKAADIREQIDALQNELNQILGGEAKTPAAVKGPKKRGMSAAGRARIAAAAKARWAAFRKGKGEAKAEKPAVKKKKKGKFSPAAKARLSALAKERWARARAEGKAKL